MLAEVDGDTHRQFNRRCVTSLGDARRILARWQEAHAIPAPHVHDNSDIDLDVLFEQMDVDFHDVTDCCEAGAVS